MSSLPVLSACAMSLFLNGAEPGQEGLRYRATLTFRGRQEPVVAEFMLKPIPAARTRNRTRNPRMGGWRLEAIHGKGSGAVGPEVFARLERLMYFSGPAPELVQKPLFIQYGRKECQVWQAPAPPGLDAVVYLVQATPGILVLSSFRGRFASGELEVLDLRLKDFRLAPQVVPAADGMVLLSTLPNLARALDSEQGTDGGTEVIE